MTELNTKFEIIDLGKAGVDFLREELADWGGLAESAGRLPLDQGIVQTVAQKNRRNRFFSEFHRGGKQLGEEDLHWLLAHCRKRFESYPHSALITQDPCNSPDFPWVTQVDYPIFFYKGQIYHYVNLRDISKEKLDEILYTNPRTNISFSYIVNCEISDSIKHQEISDNTFEALALNIVDILVKVYDGESHILWARTD